MIKVYSMNTAGIDASDSSILRQMSEKRLEKINKSRALKSKKQSIGAELLLNYALKKEIGLRSPVEWETDENGKLFIPNANIYVNLSHSGDYAACAVCSSEVGIDIQQMKTAKSALAKRFFTEEEYVFVKSSASADDAFFDIWVRKESFIKAVGKGLAIPLSSFSVLKNTVDYEGRTYCFKKYSIKDKSYKLCVCFAV